MDLTSVLRNEIFRPTVTLVIPGGVAVSPYIAIVFHYFTNLKKLTTDYFSVFGIVLFLIFVGAGLIVDDIGSWLESILGSRLGVKGEYKDHMKEWKKYWRSTFKEEPIGHRYLRTVLLSLKFELNLSVSLVLLWFGLFWLYGICYITGLQLSWIAKLYKSIIPTLSRYQFLFYSPNLAAKGSEEHKLILDSIKKGNYDEGKK